LLVNPAEDVRYTAPEKEIFFFTPEEIAKLAKTATRQHTLDLKPAFLFTCHTGLRECDLKRLTFGVCGSLSGPNYGPSPISKFKQEKTGVIGRVVLNDVSRDILLGQWAQLSNAPVADRLKFPV
jgi:integrase